MSNNEPQDNFIWRLTHLNPAVYKGLVLAVVWVLASVGVAVSPNVPDSIIGLIAAVLAVVQALWTRGSVTPNAKVVSYLADPVNAPQHISPGEAVTTASDRAIISAAKNSGS